MIEKVTCYKTQDGDLFESREMAIREQKRLRREMQVKKWIDKNLDPTPAKDIVEHGAFSDWIPVWWLKHFIMNNGIFLEAVQEHLKAGRSMDTEQLLLPAPEDLNRREDQVPDYRKMIYCEACEKSFDPFDEDETRQVGGLSLTAVLSNIAKPTKQAREEAERLGIEFNTIKDDSTK